MIKINSAQNDGVVIGSGQEKMTQSQKGQHYLLNEPIKDTTSFSESETEAQPKKSHTLAWVLGLGAAVAGVVIAVRSHKKVDTKAVEKAVEKTTTENIADEASNKIINSRKEESQKIERELKQSKQNLQKAEEYAEKAQEQTKKTERELKQSKQDLQKEEEHAEKIRKMAEEVKTKMEPKLIKELKDENLNLDTLEKKLSKTFPEDGNLISAFFDRPSELINRYFTSNEQYSSESLKTIYQFTKKRLPLIKDPIELEKSQNCETYILNKLKFTYIKEGNTAEAEKIEKVLDQELDNLFDRHFGKNGADLSENPELNKEFMVLFKNASQNSFLDKMKFRMNDITIIHPSEVFPTNLNLTAGTFYDVVMTNLPKNVEISKANMEQINAAKKMNDKALEISERLGFSKSFTYKQIKIQKTKMDNLENTSKLTKAGQGLETFKQYLKINKIEIDNLKNIDDLTLEHLQDPKIQNSLKKAYKQVSVQYHPDKFTLADESTKKIKEEHFKIIGNAFDDMGLKNK